MKRLLWSLAFGLFGILFAFSLVVLPVIISVAVQPDSLDGADPSAIFITVFFVVAAFWGAAWLGYIKDDM